jgi:pimeloyl-ACP methyl ester carboxylesterase
MLPGMMCDGRLFAPQAEAFKHDRDVIIPTLDGAETMTDLAHDVLDQAPELFALAGLSMGGIVAMEMVREAPGRITKLALMDTNPNAETQDRQEIRKGQMEKVRAGGLREVIRDDMKPHYLAHSPHRREILDLCMAMATDLGQEVFLKQSRALADRADQTEVLKQVAVPTLILYGAEDRLCPAEYHNMMHDLISGSNLVKIEDAGHLPCLEQPEKTTAALRRWLEE